MTTTSNDRGASPRVPEELQRSRKRSTSNQTHAVLRWLHVYTSMISLVIMLFFGITGITLNHPSWTFGTSTVEETVEGALPSNSIADGEVDFLVVSEFVRSTHGVTGAISDYGTSGTEGTLSFKGPGTSADLSFDTDTGNYQLFTVREGAVGVMNDLHKGRDTSTTWKWVIDISGALLVAIGVTGIGIQLFLRKRRRSALTWAAIGTVLTVVLIWLATR